MQRLTIQHISFTEFQAWDSIPNCRYILKAHRFWCYIMITQAVFAIGQQSTCTGLCTAGKLNDISRTETNSANILGTSLPVSPHLQLENSSRDISLCILILLAISSMVSRPTNNQNFNQLCFGSSPFICFGEMAWAIARLVVVALDNMSSNLKISPQQACTLLLLESCNPSSAAELLILRVKTFDQYKGKGGYNWLRWLCLVLGTSLAAAETGMLNRNAFIRATVFIFIISNMFWGVIEFVAKHMDISSEEKIFLQRAAYLLTVDSRQLNAYLRQNPNVVFEVESMIQHNELIWKRSFSAKPRFFKNTIFLGSALAQICLTLLAVKEFWIFQPDDVSKVPLFLIGVTGRFMERFILISAPIPASMLCLGWLGNAIYGNLNIHTLLHHLAEFVFILMLQALWFWCWTKANLSQGILYFSCNCPLAMAIFYHTLMSPVRTRWPKLSKTLRLGYRKNTPENTLDIISIHSIEKASRMFRPVTKELLVSTITKQYGSNIILEPSSQRVQPFEGEAEEISSWEKNSVPRRDIGSSQTGITYKITLSNNQFDKTQHTWNISPSNGSIPDPDLDYLQREMERSIRESRSKEDIPTKQNTVTHQSPKEVLKDGTVADELSFQLMLFSVISMVVFVLWYIHVCEA